MSSTRPMATRWSPPSWVACSRHSTQARASWRTGDPVVPGRQPTPSNLCWLLVANTRQRASWSSERMLAQNTRVRWILGQLVEVRDGANTTSGGSSDRALKAWQVNPAGPSASAVVTTATPVAKWPSTSRNRAVSKVGAPTRCRSSSAPPPTVESPEVGPGSTASPASVSVTPTPR
jgi:hypothetical protein